MCAEQGGKPVDIALWQDQRDVPRCFVFAYELILSQEKSSLVMALLQQCAIRMAVIGEQRVVAGSAQVAAKLSEHFVAKKTGR